MPSGRTSAIKPSDQHDCILSKMGDVIVVYEAMLPEIFTLSNQEYESFHQSWIKAIKVLPRQLVLLSLK